MSLHSHLVSLQEKHASLEAKITAEDLRPQPDVATLSRLKLEKLRLKEEMERFKTV